MALNRVREIVDSTTVVVFRTVKEPLTQVGAFYKAIDMDVERDGDLMQAALAEWTGQGRVPNVLSGGKHVGGFDDVFWKYQEGRMAALLVDAGAIANNSSQHNVM